MNELVWLFVGTLAFAVSTLAIREGARLFSKGRGNAIAETLGGYVGMALWLLWSFGAMNVETVSNGETVTTTHEPVALLGVVFAVTLLVVALDGTVRLFNAYESSEDLMGQNRF